MFWFKSSKREEKAVRNLEREREKERKGKKGGKWDPKEEPENGEKEAWRSSKKRYKWKWTLMVWGM